MNCNKCGATIEEGYSFCWNCGAPLPKQGGTLQTATDVKTVEKEQPLATEKKKDIKEKKSKQKDKNEKKNGKKKAVGLVITITIILSLIGAFAFFWTKMFPLNVSVEANKKDLTTTEASIDKLKLTVRSNQPITSVRYAFGSENISEEDYAEAKLDSGHFERVATIKDIPLEPGANKLTIQVKTQFGSKKQTIKITRDLGFTTAPDESSYVPISDNTNLVSNELIIVFKDEATENEINKLIEKYDGTVVGRIYAIGEYHVRFTGSGEDYINDLKEYVESEEIVDAVFFNLEMEDDVSYYPNDGEYDSWNTDSPGGNNWGLEAINAPGAWDYRNQLSIVKVGVIDTWLEYDHPDLKINTNKISVLPTDEFHTISDIHKYYDENVGEHKCENNLNDRCVFCSMKDHGTHCSGIIAANVDNGKGVAGVATNADLYFATYWYLSPQENHQMSKSSTTSGLVYNISFLVSSGCRVISISVGWHDPKHENTWYEENLAKRFDNMVRKLENEGYDFLIFKAAGNDKDGADSDLMNRAFKAGERVSRHIVIVGATTNASSLSNRLAAWFGNYEKIYNLASFSNYGDMVDLVAPGTDIYSTVRGGKYQNMDGTSMATPMAAGVACLVYGAAPGLECDDVKSILEFTYNNFCADKKQNIYSMVNAKNAVEWALKHGSVLPPQEMPIVGFVTGVIQDAETLEPIETAAVRIESLDSEMEYEASMEGGIYYIALTPGHYNMEFAAAGYSPETIYNIEVTEGTVSYNMLLNVIEKEEQPSKGYADGRIIDAFDANYVPNASLKFYRGVNNTSGTPVLTTSSDGSGYYFAELEPGNYTLYAEANGYASGSANVLVIGNDYRPNQDCTLTPVLNEGEIRVVLTWGQYPLDLDSHLIGPTPEYYGFHMYYDHMSYIYNGKYYVKLDVDDTDSYGPETTSVYVGVNGTYTFYVHDFSNRVASYSAEMATSGAQVKVYAAGMSSPVTFNVPYEDGTVWKVFSITNGVVTPINTMSYESDPVLVGTY